MKSENALHISILDIKEDPSSTELHDCFGCFALENLSNVISSSQVVPFVGLGLIIGMIMMVGVEPR